jgi:hypothetical protein
VSNRSRYLTEINRELTTVASTPPFGLCTMFQKKVRFVGKKSVLEKVRRFPSQLLYQTFVACLCN